MTLDAFYLLTTAFSYAFLWMSFLWILHFILKNAAIVDVGWPICLFIFAIIYVTQTPYVNVPETILLFVVGLWAIRLSSYLLVDRIWNKSEEGRYRHLREKWKTNVALKLFFFYHAQTVLNIFLSLPFLLIVMDPTPNEWILFIGALVALLGIAGESVSDLQLRFFKLNPVNQGQVCRSGLWAYSRHPNYFFEFIYWCGIALMGQSAENGYISWIAPALILCTIFKITGIPATEAQALQSKGNAYKSYMRDVSKFVPLGPKRNKH